MHMFGVETNLSTTVLRSELRFMLKFAIGFAVALAASATLSAQAVYDGPGVSDDVPVATMVDLAGNTIVTGTSLTEDGGTFATVKYDNVGGELWSQRRFRGSPAAMVIDPWVFQGNIYVAGSAVSNYGLDYAVVAYDEDGVELWWDLYDRTFDEDRATSITLDLSGNVIVTGISYSASHTAPDIVTIWYDAATGERIRVVRYDSGGDDFAAAVRVSPDNHVYVAGSNGADFKIISYSSFGQLRWAVSRDEAGSDTPVAMHIRSATEIYITGHSGTNNSGSVIKMLKYNSFGERQWTRTFDRHQQPGGHDRPTGLSVDSSGNVYFAGMSRYDGLDDIVVLKVTPAGNLDRSWIYGPGDTFNRTASVVVDGQDNVYVAGSTPNAQTMRDLDYILLKLDPLVSSRFLWTRRFNSGSNGSDEAKAIAIGADGNIVVTGKSEFENGTDYVTIQYNGQGKRLF
jgi:hypothetical protein